MNVWVRNFAPEDIELMIGGLGNVRGDVGGIAFSLMTRCAARPSTAHRWSTPLRTSRSC